MVGKSISELLDRAQDKAREKYGEIQHHAAKRGQSRKQYFEIQENGKTFVCVTKVSSGGRISFEWDSAQKSWKSLSAVDRVLVIAPTSLDGEDYVVSMFDRDVLVEAFNANRKAQQQHDQEHLPNWIAPFHEKGRDHRGTGDGFGAKALWSEPLDIRTETHNESSNEALAPKQPEADTRTLTIQQAKVALAKTFGVSPDAVKITIEG